jgi:hypothetical protein
MLALIILAAGFLTLARPAAAAGDDVQVSWRLLDYLGVD